MLVRELKKLPVNSAFTGQYMVELCEVKLHRDGNFFLKFKLRDKTGSFEALWWKPDKEDTFPQGSVVLVEGRISYHNGRFQPKLIKVEPVNEEEIENYRFQPETSVPVEKLLEELKDFVNSVKNRFLSQLLRMFFEDEVFLNKFISAPAGKSIHHSTKGGLLEHTIEVARICELVSSYNKRINRDLLITSALLHDIGKVREYEFKNSLQIERTLEGILLGHLYMGCEMVSEKIAKIPGFPEDLKVQLIHCLLSHHGEYEYGSPKKPKTIEAVTLAYADVLSAKVKSYEEFIQRELAFQKGFTPRHYAFGIPLYWGGGEDEEVEL
jgi:3'-5' exoribonuclease